MFLFCNSLEVGFSLDPNKDRAFHRWVTYYAAAGEVRDPWEGDYGYFSLGQNKRLSCCCPCPPSCGARPPQTHLHHKSGFCCCMFNSVNSIFIFRLDRKAGKKYTMKLSKQKHCPGCRWIHKTPVLYKSSIFLFILIDLKS